MSLLNSALHWGGKKSHTHFLRALNSPEKTQQRQLKCLLLSLKDTGYGKLFGYDKINSYSSFQSRLPIADYQHFEDAILKQMNGQSQYISPGNLRFIPTSGSTSQRKWIPFNHLQKESFDAASTPWLFDLNGQYPGLRSGSQYWSLSWLPNALRSQGNIADDLELFPEWKKKIWHRLMAAPSSLAFSESSENALLATCVYLAARRDLALLSVWSPTFAISLVRHMAENWDEILEILASQTWPWPMPIAAPVPHCSQKTLNILRGMGKEEIVDNPESLWPKLSLISAWDSHSSAPAAKKLKEQFPNTPLQGKGLWATEGVVSIPFQNRMPLAIRSHFYEFQCLDSEKVFLAHQLKKGMQVKPILSCGNGLVRYKLEDILSVTEFAAQTPCFHFEGRAQTTDLCGEKLSANIVTSVLKQSFPELGTATLFAYQADVSRYHLHSEQLISAPKLDQALNKIHHYCVARELGQLAEPTASSGSLKSWESLDQNAIRGAVKVETLSYWKKDEDPCVFFQTKAISNPYSFSSPNRVDVSRGGVRL